MKAPSIQTSPNGHADIRMMSSGRIPTEDGEFRLCLYQSAADGKEHLALIRGQVAEGEDVLTRVHSECFTGDVLGSRRCDCRWQLQATLRMMAQAGRGVLIYLRQEGRGIGLINKLRAYGLQDQGYDTVDANLLLGLGADEREYGAAAQILADLKVRSVQLITNNPRKIEGLRDNGIPVRQRIPLEGAVTDENRRYLSTKVRRLEHLLTLDSGCSVDAPGLECQTPSQDGLEKWLAARSGPPGRPLVTLTFAQSLDGSIALVPGQPLVLSGRESRLLTHRLRRWHDGILVGIGTVLSDDPQLTVRLVEGANPQPIVVDSRLRFPLHASLLHHPRPPWIFTGPHHDAARRRALEERGAVVMDAPLLAGGEVDLAWLLRTVGDRGIQRLMVEGGARVLNAFLREAHADAAVITIAPVWIGGLQGITRAAGDARPFPNFKETMWNAVGDDMVMCGALDWTKDTTFP